MRRSIGQILDYSLSPADPNTVRRAYKKWRAAQGPPVRCDIEACPMHVPGATWQGQPIRSRLILDHIDGNRDNNRASNLRFLCPNCNSQTDTYGGKNKGRIRNKTADSYHVRERDGRLEVKVALRGQSMSMNPSAEDLLAPKRDDES